MTPALVDRPASLFADLGAGGSAVAGRLGGGRVTLEERLDATLRAVLDDSAADCPVCHARMTREGEAGRCGGCGSRLS